jgi:hypothetical protein
LDVSKSICRDPLYQAEQAQKCDSSFQFQYALGNEGENDDDQPNAKGLEKIDEDLLEKIDEEKYEGEDDDDFDDENTNEDTDSNSFNPVGGNEDEGEEWKE